MVGLYDPHTIVAITNQFYEGAIRLHATKQTLNTFFWQAVPNRGPKHLEPPQSPEKSTSAQVGNSSSFSRDESTLSLQDRGALARRRSAIPLFRETSEDYLRNSPSGVVLGYVSRLLDSVESLELKHRMCRIGQAAVSKCVRHKEVANSSWIAGSAMGRIGQRVAHVAD